MPVYLSFGKNIQGNFFHIDALQSGRTPLICPFCSCPLIAVKGAKKSAHFRHDGETCHESLNEIPQIPAWHHFHLNYPLKVVETLKQGYDAESKSPNVFKLNASHLPHSLHHELLEHDVWTDNVLFTETAKVILGSLTMERFSKWMRDHLQQRIQDLRHAIEQGQQHRAWLEIESHRQQSILTASLYLFEYQLGDGSIIHKVGRTSRQPEQRLKETVQDLEKATDQSVVKSKILRVVANCGHVEQYVFHRYRNQVAKVGLHTEYLVLDKRALKKLKSEFTRLANSTEPFNKNERFIATGRWKYEEKRLMASKRGIELTQRENGKFGRPKGSTLSHDAFLEKHSDIFAYLKLGKSINQTAEMTGKGRSTVKRVKAVMNNKTR